MKIPRLILSACFIVVNSGNIDAASFDCGKAASEVEKIICGDDGLSRLDDALNEAYLQALKHTNIRKQTIESQRQWLKNERNACRDAESLKKVYETRIKELGLSSPSTSAYDYRWDQTPYPEDDQQTIVVDPEICKCYEENLRYFARRNTPMACDRPIAPHLKDRIKKVDWEDLDPDRYSDLLRAIGTCYGDLPGTGEDIIQRNLKYIRTDLTNGAWVFRRAKLSLVGRINDHSEPYWIVQYGPNDISPNNPSKAWRCNPRRWGDLDSKLRLYIVSERKHELTRELFSRTNSTMGQHLRLIDNRLFVENIYPEGLIELNAVDTALDWAGTVCDFELKRAK